MRHPACSMRQHVWNHSPEASRLTRQSRAPKLDRFGGRETQSVNGDLEARTADTQRKLASECRLRSTFTHARLLLLL
jgi:hypothetical protein